MISYKDVLALSLQGLNISQIKKVLKKKTKPKATYPVFVTPE